MRKTRRYRRSDRGVSPVIGTILLVAITVVLVTTIYVAMSKFLPNFGGAPKVGLQTESAGLANNQIMVVVISNEKNDGAFGLYDIVLVRDNTLVVVNSSAVKTGTVATSTDGSGSMVNFTDDGNGKMSAGDRFMFSKLHLNSRYDFILLFGDQTVGAATWNT